ncbi:hypothetical protein B0H14DRAFT_3469312 [Mycena olivaceomarginata]|nr:hypothetical protein B0H14DRAFT_3469312 [Mycena olivaceomarginata]
MAAPTQELPTWLSYTTITLPETTVTSVIFLPLTYYGPSIPLDSDWVYGGLTIPRRTTTDTTPPSSATPSAPSTSAVVSPTSSSASPTASSSTSSSGSPAASSSASGLSPSSHLSRGGLIGVIFGSVLGALVLFLLLLCCWLRYGARRRDRTRGESTAAATREKSRTPLTALFRRRPRARTRFTIVTPPVPGAPLHDDDDLEGDWTMVGSPFSPTSPTSPTSPRSPGSPEPGQGVTEADPFLTRTRLPNPHSAEGGVAGGGSASGSGSGGEQRLGVVARDGHELREQRGRT